LRQYSIGAMLLDAQDPFRIRGRLRTPLLTPPNDERAGYVPNVVYSCGALIHQTRLFLPYAIADQTTAAVSVELEPLLDRLIADGP
jgi:predicted GH43/DUF377 family glycosyl hydrolase